MMGKQGAPVILITWVIVFLLGYSVCLGRPLMDSIEAQPREEVVSVSFQLDGHAVKNGEVTFVRLPKGPVPPSGPSPIHNSIPVQSVSNHP
ncbi:hypothetical protein SUGI_0807410 [Cryptomeria japonica]|nr:hypothetical protein SUGI_0807410 [Cryptomeria japonica]